MNFEQYFLNRTNLVRSILVETSDEPRPVTGWRSFVAGGVCVALAVGFQFWASTAQPDSGFFARTTTFLLTVAVGGLWLLSLSLLADYRLTRFALSNRDGLKEKTVRQLLRVDGLLARRLVQPSAFNGGLPARDGSNR